MEDFSIFGEKWMLESAKNKLKDIIRVAETLNFIDLFIIRPCFPPVVYPEPLFGILFYYIFYFFVKHF